MILYYYLVSSRVFHILHAHVVPYYMNALQELEFLIAPTKAVQNVVGTCILILHCTLSFPIPIINGWLRSIYHLRIEISNRFNILLCLYFVQKCVLTFATKYIFYANYHTYLTTIVTRCMFFILSILYIICYEWFCIVNGS